MNLTNRQIKIVNMLLKEKTYKPVKYFSTQLDVSNRTIYSDLKHIELVSKKLGFNLDRKKGVGIRAMVFTGRREIRGTDELITTTMYEVEERRIKILELLLFSGRTFTYQELADYFFVSKSSIHADLVYIKEQYITSSTIKLVSDSDGTRFTGSEEHFQNSFVRFNEFYKEGLNKIDVFEMEEEQEYIHLEILYGRKLVKKCRKAIYDFISDNLESIAEYYIDSILNRLIVLVYRSSKGFHLNSIGQKTHEEESNVLLNYLASMLKVDFTEGDIAYFAKHMKAAKMQKRKEEEDFTHVIQKIIEKLSEMVNVNFMKDGQLQKQLENHFPTMVYRLRHNISIDNPLLSEIKQEFGMMYNITWYIMASLEKELEVTFTDKEIGFISIYFQSNLERMQMSKKVLIVCPTGITTSGLLYNRVKRILPPLDNLEIASFSQLEYLDMSSVDFIISTAHIKIKEIPVVVVSPLLSDADMQKISNFYNALFILKDQSTGELIKEDFNKIKKYIHAEFMQFDSDYNSSEQLITKVTDQLALAGFVHEEFKTSVLEREKAGGTDLLSGIALPHGNPDYVKETIISIVVNKNPIRWNDTSIRAVILICIAKKDIQHVKDIISSVYNLIENKDVVDKVFINSNKADFMQLLGGEYS